MEFEANHQNVKPCPSSSTHTHTGSLITQRPSESLSKERKSKVVSKEARPMGALLSMQTLCVKCCGELRRVVGAAWHET